MKTIPFVVFSYGLLMLILAIIIFGKKGREEDNNLKRMKTIGKEAVRNDYQKVDTTFYERMIKPKIDKLNNVDVNGNKPSKNARQKQQREKLALDLRKAGLHITPSSFQFIKTAFLLVSIVVSIGLGLILMRVTDYFFVVIILGAFVGLLGPSLFLSSKVKSHQNAVKAQLADTLDLLSVCMEAGLSFDASLMKISERMSGPLIDELVTVFKQIQLGKNRNEALKSLSDSSDVDELKTFISAVVQANQLGIPITNVLSAQSEQLRINKKEEIKTVAAKVPTKMTIPTVLLILPAIICVIMGPLVISLLDTFKDGGIF